MHKTLIQTLLAAFCAILATAPLEGGGVMLIGMRNAMFGGAKLSAKSYVQDGLVAMWDGIENAGWGKHDSAATNWHDLSGNGQTMTLNNGSSYFDEKGLLLPQNGSVYGVSSAAGPLATCNGANMTAELCGDVSALVRSDSGSGIFWSLPVPSSGGYVLAPIAARFAANDIVVATAYNQYFYTGSLFDSVAIQFAIIQNASRIPTAYKRGAEVYLGANNNSSVNIANITKVGVGMLPSTLSGSSWRSMKNFTMRIFSLRLYNRVLSESELAANYAVDKARFNLPDAT